VGDERTISIQSAFNALKEDVSSWFLVSDFKKGDSQTSKL
jgi:hypothetical protein